MKKENIEIYENGNNWVVSWEQNSRLKERSESFPSKQQAEEFKKELES